MTSYEVSVFYAVNWKLCSSGPSHRYDLVSQCEHGSVSVCGGDINFSGLLILR